MSSRNYKLDKSLNFLTDMTLGMAIGIVIGIGIVGTILVLSKLP